MLTKEEREETLKTIRKGGIARNVSEAYVLLLHCIGIRPQLPAVNTYKPALERLANLIDPTCHEIVELESDGVGAPHRYTSRCSNCGQVWGEAVYFPQVPVYCPNCGARVVCDED